MGPLCLKGNYPNIMTPDVIGLWKGGVEMAFVRWRGYSATLLATVYEQGRSRQVLLAALGGGYRVPTGVREDVTERFPTLIIDWNAVNRAMAKGPLGSTPLTEKQLTYLDVELHLQKWAKQASPYPRESKQLLAAANVLSNWCSRENS